MWENTKAEEITMGHRNTAFGLNECTCPICGKLFYVPLIKEWAYKTTTKHRGDYVKPVCSYSCANKSRKG